MLLHYDRARETLEELFGKAEQYGRMPPGGPIVCFDRQLVSNAG